MFCFLEFLLPLSTISINFPPQINVPNKNKKNKTDGEHRQITSHGWSVAAEHQEHTVTLWNALKIRCGTHKQTHTEHSACCVCRRVCVCVLRPGQGEPYEKACICWQAGRRQQPITQSVCRPHSIQSTLYCGGRQHNSPSHHLHNKHTHALTALHVCLPVEPSLACVAASLDAAKH